MSHRTTSRFWDCYWSLSPKTREVADKSFSLLRENPRHPSLHCKRIGEFWSARIGAGYRALAVPVPEGQNYIRVWIGTHDEYERLIENRYPRAEQGIKEKHPHSCQPDSYPEHYGYDLIIAPFKILEEYQTHVPLSLCLNSTKSVTFFC